MLNQERVCEMTRLAIFDQNEGEKCKPMQQYFRSDYVGKEILKSLFYGTMAFCFAFGMWALCCLEELLEKLTVANIQAIAVKAGKYYIGFMVVYLVVTIIVYQRRYTLGRRKLGKYYTHLKKVDKQYRQEESLKY